MLPTVDDIRDAWLHDVAPNEWIVRRNKAHKDGCQWEVVHVWGGNVISDDTQKVIARYDDQHAAHQCAFDMENDARAAAVLAMLQKLST